MSGGALMSRLAPARLKNAWTSASEMPSCVAHASHQKPHMDLEPTTSECRVRQLATPARYQPKKIATCEKMSCSVMDSALWRLYCI